MLKFISLNIERSKHLERNIPFFLMEKPDILFLQEVFEGDLEKISQSLSMPFFVWLKHALVDKEENSTGKEGYSGIAVFSRVPFVKTEEFYYHMPPQGISLELSGDAKRESNAQCAVAVTLLKDAVTYTFVETHFTWSAGGEMSTAQAEDFLVLKEFLRKQGPHALIGDLNAPRGREMWEKFAELYDTDNIPATVTSTLDAELHRVKNLNLVVDCLFTQKPFFSQDVRVVSGVSDHKAIVAYMGTEK